MNFANFRRTPFLIECLRWLLLHLNNLMMIITKQEKGTYLLSIEILSDPNNVYLYLTLTLRNLTSPKNLHLSYIPHLRVSSIRIASSKELSEFLLPIFSSSFYLMGFSCNRLVFSLSFKSNLSQITFNLP